MAKKYTVKHMSPTEVAALNRSVADGSPYRQVLGYGEFAVVDEEGKIMQYCQVLSDTEIVIDQWDGRNEIIEEAGKAMRPLYDELKIIGERHNVPANEVLDMLLGVIEGLPQGEKK